MPGHRPERNSKGISAVAAHRHKREPNARRPFPFRAKAVTIAAPLAVLATASAVTLGVVNTSPEAPTNNLAASVSDPTPADLGEQDRKAPALSRSAPRNAPRIEREPTKVEKLMTARAVNLAIKQAETSKWTTATLNLWSQPGDGAERLGELAEGEKVLVTGRALYDRVEIVVDGESRWVTAGYLADEKPFTLGGACTNGTTIDSGVSPSIVKIHEAVCAEFPEITTYGTLRGGGGDHSLGKAVDIMVSGDRGWQVAEFVRKYYSELGVSYIIYSQQIWSVERSSEGWRGMEDRGSATANHYDHVHVSVY
jgi:uncharacterized protein YraI